MAESFDDLSTRQQIAALRHAAKQLRAGGKDAEWVKPEYRNELAYMFEKDANRLEAGEDLFVEEEECPEEAAAAAEPAFDILRLLRRENVDTLGELFGPDKEDLN